MVGLYAGLLVTVALMWAITWTDGIPSFAGPYIVRYDSIVDCPEATEDQGRHHLRVTHFNPYKPFEMQTVTGNITLKKTINGTMKLSLVIDIRSNNQWKYNYFVFNNTKRNKCEFIAKINNGSDCQIQPGTFSLDRVPLSKSYPLYPVLPYGHYRMRIQVGEESEIAYCSHTELQFIPRP